MSYGISSELWLTALDRCLDGPWKIGKLPANGCPIIGTEQGMSVCMESLSTKEPEQADKAMAVAKLIAAAPTMRDALKRIAEMAYSTGYGLSDAADENSIRGASLCRLIKEEAEAAIKQAT